MLQGAVCWVGGEGGRRGIGERRRYVCDEKVERERETMITGGDNDDGIRRGAWGDDYVCFGLGAFVGLP